MNTLMVAVSGGVDSMVLLDLIVRQAKYNVVVAHVDHGMRVDSPVDAAFVEAVAGVYGVEYVAKKLYLGEHASEDLARKLRYEWLFEIAQNHDASLAVGHHRDDVIGSIAINLIRGTGWRGLAVMNRPRVVRPLLGVTKQQLYEYALTHQLEWVEDESNRSNIYLRNRIRAQTMQLARDEQEALYRLRNQQVALSHEIDNESAKLAPNAAGSRYFMTMIDEATAIELLRRQIATVLGELPHRNHAARALLAIKSAQPDSVHDITHGVRLKFSTNGYVVDTDL